MQQNYQITKAPTVGSSSAIGGASAWSNPSRITTDDGSSAAWSAFAGGQHSEIKGTTFGISGLPDDAVIDGLSVYLDGSQVGCYGSVLLNISGAVGKDIATLNGTYGGANDLWGLSQITRTDLANLQVSVSASDVSGGDGIADLDFMSVTVFYHIEVVAAPTDVPTRVEYKVRSRSGKFLGLLPNVTSKFGFSQDINSAGSTIAITCGEFVNNEVTVEAILDNDGNPIQDNNNLPILGAITDIKVARGASVDDAIFKNSNRIEVWLYNYWYPNGKVMFVGQVNKVSFQYGGGNSQVQLLVYSDGIDLDNYIARGYPFNYTTDVSQTTSGGTKYVNSSATSPAYQRYGQTFKTGAAVTNIGAITLRMFGGADVTVSLLSGPNGNELGSITKRVDTNNWENIRFEFAQLIDVSPSTTYFFSIAVASGGQQMAIANNPSNVYANGAMYIAQFTGTSGGSFSEDTGAGDFYFVTASGVPTTTVTYSTDDPVSDMAHGILLDYNTRGGRIKERDFAATGLSLTYTFVVATILTAIKKILELAPTGYYAYIDLGTSEIDIQPTSTTPDFTIVKGKDISQLNIAMSIEQVKNYLLYSGGEVTPGVNLYRDYQDTESTTNYGVRLATKSDNRVTVTATADAIGNTFIDENSEETQETSVVVLNDEIDITLLTPGKTIGFRNFGNFIDDLVLQIARRDYQPAAATLTLGRLPATQSAEIQRINRELLMQQTISNPNAPS